MRRMWKLKMRKTETRRMTRTQRTRMSDQYSLGLRRARLDWEADDGLDESKVLGLSFHWIFEGVVLTERTTADIRHSDGI